jgi:hypothetical protein
VRIFGSLREHELNIQHHIGVARGTSGKPQLPKDSPPKLEKNPQVKSSDGWLMEDIEVNIIGGSLLGCKGIIKGHSREGCQVLLDKGEIVSVSSSYLEPVVPHSKGHVTVMEGQFKGRSGTLVGIRLDDGKGMVELPHEVNICIIDLEYLASSK